MRIASRWHRHKSRASRVLINLEALAFKTASNITANEGTSRPVVFLVNGVDCSKNLRVTSGGTVMFGMKNLAVKTKVGGYIVTVRMR